MTFVLRMVWRETRSSWARLMFFFLCAALGVAAIVVLRSVVQNVRITLTKEARSLVGGSMKSAGITSIKSCATLQIVEGNWNSWCGFRYSLPWKPLP